MIELPAFAQEEYHLNKMVEEANKKAGQYFTNMMLDGRFVTLGENEWDLRSRHTFDKVHIEIPYSKVDVYIRGNNG